MATFDDNGRYSMATLNIVQQQTRNKYKTMN